MDGLDTFAPAPRIVALHGGGTIEVMPLRMRQVPAFARVAGPLFAVLATGDLRAALAEHWEALRAALAVATGLHQERIDELLPDEAADLAAAVAEANLDFFARAAGRLRAGMTGLATGLAASPGAPSSPGSPSADTGRATSSS